MVLLPEDADLADGATVEVRTLVSAEEAESTSGAEARFRERLIEAGLLAEPSPQQPRSVEDRTPVCVQGRPLSEDILKSRR
jgi:hypothetical protein